MPRVHFVKSARKDNPAVKKGESYFWWRNYKSPKRYSATRPRESQITGSEYFSQLYAISEGVEDALGDFAESQDPQAIYDALDEARSEVETLGEECREKRDNMEENFPNGCPVMEMLEERAEGCEQLAQEIEDVAGEIQSIIDNPEAEQEAKEEAEAAAEAEDGAEAGDKDESPGESAEEPEEPCPWTSDQLMEVDSLVSGLDWSSAECG
jgi:hypothetical protein